MRPALVTRLEPHGACDHGLPISMQEPLTFLMKQIFRGQIPGRLRLWMVNKCSKWPEEKWRPCRYCVCFLQTNTTTQKYITPGPCELPSRHVLKSVSKIPKKGHCCSTPFSSYWFCGGLAMCKMCNISFRFAGFNNTRHLPTHPTLPASGNSKDNFSATLTTKM